MFWNKKKFLGMLSAVLILSSCAQVDKKRIPANDGTIGNALLENAEAKGLANRLRFKSVEKERKIKTIVGSRVTQYSASGIISCSYYSDDNTYLCLIGDSVMLLDEEVPGLLSALTKSGLIEITKEEEKDIDYESKVLNVDCYFQNSDDSASCVISKPTGKI